MLEIIPKSRGYNFRRREHTGKETFFTRREPEMKVKVVCEPCNNGWMSNLEQFDAKPAMKELIVQRPRPIRIHEQRIRSIAKFAFKTAIIANCMGTSGERIFSLPDRRRFAVTREIPAGFHLFLGTFRSAFTCSGMFSTRFGKSTSNGPYDIDIHICTFGIGYFMFQAVSARWTRPESRLFGAPSIFQDRLWDPLSIPCWPLPEKGFISWPPRQYLSPEIVGDFDMRWSDATARVIHGKTPR